MGEEDEKLAAEIEKIEVESRFRPLSGPFRTAVWLFAVGASAFHLVVLAAYPMDPFQFRATHLCLISSLAFFLLGARKKSPRNRFTVIDVIWVALSVGMVVYLYVMFDDYINRYGVMPEPSDVVVGTVAVIVVIEMTRRATGWALPIIAITFLLYGLFGQHLPGMLRHAGYDYSRIFSYMYSTDGIAYIPLGVSATFIFLFVLFGAFLRVSGIGSVFTDLATAIAGGARGGPAKVAIIASSLFGTISGSAVANVVVDGWITIPLMKRVGYKSHVAAAIEATASTGGQIMPPVMGAGAFVMAEILGITYSEVIVAAAIPAVLYYMALMWMVDFEAVKEGLKGLPKSQLPRLTRVLITSGYQLVPLAVLIYSLVVLETSVIRAGLWSIVAALVVSMVKQATRMGPQKLLQALYQGAVGCIEVAATCACAGIIIGVLSLTGLGIKISTIIISLAGGYLFPALFLTMVISLILGMGIPTTGAYVICASVAAPAIVQMGVPALAAHLFVFYFACISAITPPVALAAYAAAAIAHANLWKVGFAAVKIAFAAYLVPFMFVYGPPMLMIGPWPAIVLTVITGLIGTMALAGAFEGFFFTKPLIPVQRVLMAASAVLLIKPGWITDLIGGGIMALVLVWIYYLAPARPPSSLVEKGALYRRWKRFTSNRLFEK